ncbi:DUF362 domain-containing protein, partial [Candidatus Bathyarchaeota archaeon]|nr:DUF362 domain-containing protein [Candidatus Bathyarchaeota archaeon]
GYEEMAKRNRVSLMNLSESPSYRIMLHGERFDMIKVPQEVMHYDFFITVPKLRIHPMLYITCALKNQFGMNPERFKSKHHPYLSQ